MCSEPPPILLVENDPATAELYSQTISQEFTVLICEREEQVIERLKDEKISAVILEPALLGGRGWAILSTIQRELAAHPVPVILCTTSEDRRRGMEMGAAAFLVKPVLPTALLGVLRKVVQPGK